MKRGGRAIVELSMLSQQGRNVIIEGAQSDTAFIDAVVPVIDTLNRAARSADVV